MTDPRTGERSYLLLAVYCVVTLAISLAVCIVFFHQHRSSVYHLPNYAGATAEALVEHHTFTFCPTDLNVDPPSFCLYASRMPAAGVVIAGLRQAVGDDTLRVSLLKTVLLLIPVWIAAGIVFASFPRTSHRTVFFLLLVPFFATPLLADIVNLQVEEGYTYSPILLAVALLLFPARWTSGGRAKWGWLLLLAGSIDLIYLAKSSMAVVVAVLFLGALLHVRSTVQRMVLLLLVAAAPGLWMVHTHAVSGRYSVGTSLDGINFHKGNNPKFLERFPPAPGVTLDIYDEELNRGHHFDNEWEYNDFHLKAGKDYLRQHPAESLTGWWRKFSTMFLSLRKVGSGESHGIMAKAETLGLVILRLFLWSAIVISGYWIVRKPTMQQRQDGLLILALFAATALPYIAGFGYTRHISVLLLPAALVLCRWSQQRA